MKLTYLNNAYVCHCTFAERTIPKQSGFRWSVKQKLWYTTHHGIAARLRQFADSKAKDRLDSYLLQIEPWTGPIPYPAHLTPFPFQINKAVPFALARNKSYLALDPGLGKTICAALITNAINAPFVYVCPPFLVKNVENEFSHWCLSGLDQGVIVPDSVIHKQNWIDPIIKLIKFKPETILFVDEAHRFKSKSARRTKILFNRFVPLFNRVVFLSGTPMPNRPMELYQVLSQLAPETIDFMTEHEFGVHYCGAYRTQWAWDYSGATNVEELASRVKNHFMLRIRTEEIENELPPRLEEMVILEDDMPVKLHEMEKKILKQYSVKDLLNESIANEHISTHRKNLGRAKANAAIEFIRNLLRDTDESILVFAWHIDVLSILSEKLHDFKPIIIDGKTDVSHRQALVDLFQTSKSRRLMIANIQAGGTGYNITKADRVIFVEYSWTPSDNLQAAKRAHRIGRIGSVLCQYLVYKDSLDVRVMEILFQKQKVIANI